VSTRFSSTKTNPTAPFLIDRGCCRHPRRRRRRQRRPKQVSPHQNGTTTALKRKHAPSCFGPTTSLFATSTPRACSPFWNTSKSLKFGGTRGNLRISTSLSRGATTTATRFEGLFVCKTSSHHAQCRLRRLQQQQRPCHITALTITIPTTCRIIMQETTPTSICQLQGQPSGRRRRATSIIQYRHILPSQRYRS
jgi:hypothetical protein